VKITHLQAPDGPTRARSANCGTLITREASIEVYGASGGGYMLTKARGGDRITTIAPSCFCILNLFRLYCTNDDPFDRSFYYIEERYFFERL